MNYFTFLFKIVLKSSKMKLLTFYLIFILFCIYSECVYLIPKNIKTQNGSSYVLIVKQHNVTAKECIIFDGNNNYSIDLAEMGKKPILKTKSTTGDVIESIDTNIITSLGNGICGFKMDKITMKTTDKWSLTIIDETKQNYTDTANVWVSEYIPKVSKVQLKVGDSLQINCIGPKLYVSYCHLFNPSGELVKTGIESCFYSSSLSKASDIGTWKCILSYENSMEETQNEFEVSKIDLDVVFTWTNETNTHVNLGCSVTQPTVPAYYCIMVRPDGQNIKMLPGLATERYTSLDTNLENADGNSVCSMQIAKPLNNNEYGLWRCEHYNKYVDPKPIGGFINVGNGTKSLAEPKIPKSVFVHVNKTLLVSCRVQYSTSYCYMRGPDGLIYPVEDERMTTLGICTFIKENVQLTDNGTWYCGFGKDTGITDDVYAFQVYIPEIIPIHPEKQSVVTRTGSDTSLKCTTRGLGDYPLQYCRFLSPDGKMFQIGNDTTQRITYEGNGLDNGECGIKIHNVKDTDTGTWSCITRIGIHFKEEEVYTNIHLSIDDNLSQASVLGLVCGVGIVVLAVGSVGIWKFRSRFISTQSTIMFDRNASNRSSDTSLTNIGIRPIVLDVNEMNYNRQIVLNENERNNNIL